MLWREIIPFESHFDVGFLKIHFDFYGDSECIVKVFSNDNVVISLDEFLNLIFKGESLDFHFCNSLYVDELYILLNIFL